MPTCASASPFSHACVRAALYVHTILAGLVCTAVVPCLWFYMYSTTLHHLTCLPYPPPFYLVTTKVS